MLGRLLSASYKRNCSPQTMAYTKFCKPALLLGLGGAMAAALGLQVSADAPDSADEQFPTDKLACRMGVAPPRRPTVLVSCGSFNPPTIMHLRMFDLATAALAERGYDVWGCYMSPVADAYGKKGLAPVQHRLQMCQLAAADTSNVMVDSWEARQQTYTRTVQVLWGSKHLLHTHQLPPPTQPRVMLLCGADLLATIAQPGVWVDPDVILRDHGIVCVCRQGTDLNQLLDQPSSLLHKYRDNIVLVEEPVPNHVSSTKMRQLLAEGQPVRYLVPDAVIAYVKQHRLYNR
ncbi:hypothetical protein COO60DRAFT_1296557 [Scenedesmus sp. NREL 46B-D3]|nr:hypothetical protein COO60DRAFT_1296557 [Scenedesmus sp. NREL 46B-D3]